MKRQLPRKAAQQGLSLVELMVASVIALAISAALAGIFAGNSRARTELDRSSRQIENGRYALELIADELRVAGFYGEVPMAGVALASASPCAVDAAQLGWQVSPLRVPAPVQSIAANQAEACLADRLAGTPAIAIRRLGTDTIPVGAVVAANDYVQTSRCNDDPAGATLVLGNAAAGFTLRNLACTAPTPVRRIVQRTYYIASCSNCGDAADAIPSLKRIELVGGELVENTLAEGIEAIGIDLGFDLDGDGAPDVWRTGVDGVAGSPANDWGNVMAVRLHVLSRTTEPTAGHVDSRAYELGLAGAVGPFGDAFKRRVYTTVIRLNNPAGRREA